MITVKWLRGEMETKIVVLNTSPALICPVYLLHLNNIFTLGLYACLLKVIPL